MSWEQEGVTRAILKTQPRNLALYYEQQILRKKKRWRKVLDSDREDQKKM